MAGVIKVLVVDDDPLVRSALAMVLAGAGDISIVGEVTDGDEVPDAVEGLRPDVVLMDIRMHRVDGLTATEHVRARRDPPQVIVLTTFDADAHVLRPCRRAPAGSSSRTRSRPTSSPPCAPSPPATRCSRRR